MQPVQRTDRPNLLCSCLSDLLGDEVLASEAPSPCAYHKISAGLNVSCDYWLCRRFTGMQFLRHVPVCSTISISMRPAVRSGTGTNQISHLTFHRHLLNASMLLSQTPWKRTSLSTTCGQSPDSVRNTRRASWSPLLISMLPFWNTLRRCSGVCVHLPARSGKSDKR